MSISVVSGILALLILCLLVYYFVKERKRGSLGSGGSIATEGTGHTSSHQSRAQVDLFQIEGAPDGALPFYLVLDFQTTGLSIIPGKEAKVIQAAWLVLDKNFRKIKQRLELVRQDEVGDYEAQRVHHIPLEAVTRYGKGEVTVIREILSDITSSAVIVCHNAEYDLAILRGALARLGLEGMEETISEKRVLCTMQLWDSLPGDQGVPNGYMSLPNLTALLTGAKITAESSGDSRGSLTAWRNVCMTRACLIRFSSLFSSELLNDTITVKEVLSSIS